MRNIFSNLMNRKFRIIEHAKKYFIISAAVIFAGIITMIVCGVLSDKTGGPVNFGMDFSGGYSLKIELGQRIADNDDYNRYVSELTDAIEGAKDADGVKFGVKVDSTQKQGEGEETSILVRYKGVEYDGKKNDEVMNDIVNPALKKALEDKFFTAADEYSGRVIEGSSIGATVSTDLLYSAIGAIVLAAVLMLLYVAFRFELSSGIAAIVTIAHDLMFMISFMAFTRIQVNSTFIAAIITIMGYAINNTIIIFDRIREMQKLPENKGKSGKEIANRAIKDSLTRTINTSITTLLAVVMITIIGVPSIREFAVPILVGLLSGIYSANCIAPSIWALWHDRKLNKAEKKYSVKPKAEKAAE